MHSETQIPTRSLLNSYDAAVFIRNLNGELLNVNQKAELLLGFSEHELIHQHISLLIPAPLLKAEKKREECVRNGERVLQNETIRFDKKQNEIAVLSCLLPLLSEQGELIGFTETIRSVANNKSERKFQALLESAPDAMVIVNREGQIVLVNAQTEKLFGYQREEIIGEKIELLMPKRYVKQHVYHRDGYFAHPKTRAMGQDLELFGLKKDGTEFPVEISLSQLETEEGILVSSAIRDITEQRAAVALKEYTVKLEISAQILEHKNAQLIDFCNIVSHNLRAPLVNIGMLIDIIDSTEDEQTKREMTSRIRPVVTSINDIFNELVESVQVRQDTEIQFDTIDIDESIEQLLLGFQVQIESYHAEIKVQHKDLKTLRYPSKYFQSILGNLISNALKYRSPDRKPIIHIAFEKKENDILLSVQDNGLGLDLNKHKDKLFKIRKVFHKHPDAKGFGLFMTKTQVETLGGKIWMESEVGFGSTFFVELKNARHA